jgi:hypothetical protein
MVMGKRKTKMDKEYQEARKRLEKVQAKYIDQPKKKKQTMSKEKENKLWEKKRLERYNQRVWKGWRYSEGKSSPVRAYNLKDGKEV